MSFTLKVEFNQEIRRLTVPDDSSSFVALVQKCQEKFNQLSNNRFIFTYVDEDGDKITLDSQEEFSQLMNERKNKTPERALRLKIELPEVENRQHNFHSPQSRPHCGPFHRHGHHFNWHQAHQNRHGHHVRWHQDQASGPTSTNQTPGIYASGVRHAGVVCDLCQEEIVGLRFKCTSCSNFDVCEKCEAKERAGEIKSHSSEQHMYMMIRRPKIVRESLLPSAQPRTQWLSELLHEEQGEGWTVVCDGCHKKISNVSFKCCLCKDFDLCESCIHLAELKHDREHSFWLRMSSSGNSGKIPRLANFYWNTPLMRELGPLLVSTAELTNMGVSNVEIRTEWEDNNSSPAPQVKPGDVQIEMDVPVGLLAGQGGCPFAQFRRRSGCSKTSQPSSQQVEPTESQVKTETHQPEAQPTPQPESQPEPQPESQPEPQPESQPEPQPESQPEPQTESQPEPQTQTETHHESPAPQVLSQTHTHGLEQELIEKLQQLNEMGFSDAERNLAVLRSVRGNLGAAINRLLN